MQVVEGDQLSTVSQGGLHMYCFLVSAKKIPLAVEYPFRGFQSKISFAF